jgi:hypothetical protein
MDEFKPASGSQPGHENRLETESESRLEKREWQQPEFCRIGAHEAEAGITSGPEILILLS